MIVGWRIGPFWTRLSWIMFVNSDIVMPIAWAIEKIFCALQSNIINAGLKVYGLPVKIILVPKLLEVAPNF